MAVPNIDPIYTKAGTISSAIIGQTANTNSDGSGTMGVGLMKVFQADGTNGSFVQRLRFSPFATAAASTTVATCLRIFISSVSSGTPTSATAWLFAEVAAPSQTVDQTTTATNFIEVPLNFILPANYTILCSSHIVNNTNTGWMAIILGGNY